MKSASRPKVRRLASSADMLDAITASLAGTSAPRHRVTTDEAEAILARVAAGEATTTVCADLELPSRSTWMRAVDSDPALAGRYRTALMARAEVLAEQALEVVFEPPRLDPLTGRVDPGWVLRQRLKWDALRWHASKLDPRKYGEKQMVEAEVTQRTINYVVALPPPMKSVEEMDAEAERVLRPGGGGR